MSQPAGAAHAAPPQPRTLNQKVNDMPKPTAPALAANRYLHLLGFGKAKAEEAPPADETDEEKKKREEEEEAARAAAEAAAGKPDDEDDEDEEMQGAAAPAQARARERARCAAIFADPAAQGNQALAATLAFDTRLPRGQALALLRSGSAAVATAVAAQAAAKPPGLDARMAGQPQPKLTSSAPAPGREAQTTALWDRVQAEAAARRGNRAA